MTRFAQRFVLEREIGAGGMARVFLARDEVLDRLVAIKVLAPDLGGTDVAKRFRREGRTAARLSHPNVVQVYDAGEDELEEQEVSYIVMEYVSGGDLKALIDREGPVSNLELARLGAEVSFGLAHAHERGVIHRDIKPHNILLDERSRPKLTDFGIARALGATSTPATRTGSYLGTALYSSPEQLRGEQVTPKSDVYSLGTTLYQAAVGEAPFTGTPIEVASQHVNEEPDAPSALGADLSDEVEALILECVDKAPDRRPTAEEVHERLLDAAESARPARTAKTPPPKVSRTHEEVERTRTSPPAAPPPPPGYVRGGGRRWRRGPVLFAAAALLVAILGVTALVTTRGGEDPIATVSPQEGQQANSSKDDGQDAASTGGAKEPSAAFTSSGGSAAPAQQGGGGGEEDPAAEAVQTVEDYFDVAASEDYQDAWNYLSSRYQGEFASRETFTTQFETLEQIEYTQGPTADEVSGDTATVSFGTIAYHTDRTDRTTGTAELVREDGEWKIDRLNVQAA